MALARVTTWNPGDTLKAADLNGEFNNILNNPISLVSPTTGAINFQTSVAHTNLTPSAVTASSGGINASLIATSSSVSVWNALPVEGQCRLNYITSSEIRLVPFQGNLIPVKSSGAIWGLMSIPSTGVSLSSTNFATASSMNYIYAFNSTGVLTLVGQTSSFSHATSTENGVEIMTTDATRTLVGMVYTSTTAQNFSTVQAFTSGVVTGLGNLVASYFKRRDRGGFNAMSSNHTLISTSYTALDLTQSRVNFLTWGDEDVGVGVTGIMVNSAANITNTAVAFDGATAPESNALSQMSNTNNAPIGIWFVKSGLSEGFHTADLIGSVSAGTGTWGGTTTPANAALGVTAITVKVRQ